MNSKRIYILILLSALVSCESHKTDKKLSNSSSNAAEGDESECDISDGIHSAAVDYYNPSTGYSASYTLDVEVEACQVVQIDFSNGGYLDGHHIEPTDIDKDGDASVEDDRGRSFVVHIRD